MPNNSDDNSSTNSSSSSVTNTKTACPFCETKHQTRYLFKHIVNHHPDKIYQSVGTSKHIKEGLEDESLLELDFCQIVYDEDDEFQEFPYNTETKIYGCLGCNQTYTTNSRAKAHWKKSVKCHKDHIKYVQRHLKKVEEFEKRKPETDWISKLSDAELNLYLERLARWYYRVVNLDVPYFLKLDMNKFFTFKQEFLEFPIHPPSEKMNKGEKVFTLQRNMKLLGDFQSYMGRLTQPYDYQIPNPWYLNSPLSFEEEGLPPVGTDFNKRTEDYIKKTKPAFHAPIQDIVKKDNETKFEASPEPTLTHETISKPLSRSTTPLRSLETITEEPPKKEKRPSITTLNNKDLATMFRAPSPAPQQRFPSIIGNTKRQIKISS